MGKMAKERGGEALPLAGCCLSEFAPASNQFVPPVGVYREVLCVGDPPITTGILCYWKNTCYTRAVPYVQITTKFYDWVSVWESSHEALLYGSVKTTKWLGARLVLGWWGIVHQRHVQTAKQHTAALGYSPIKIYNWQLVHLEGLNISRRCM
jgi:hypothetical protein